VLVAQQPDVPGWGREVGRLIEAAAEAGIRQLVCTDGVLGQREVARRLQTAVRVDAFAAPLVTVIGADLDDDLRDLPPTPALLLVAPDDPRIDGHRIVARLPPGSLAVLPAGHPSAERPDMTMSTMHPGGPTTAVLTQRLAACRI
jgi:hypothetical protein